MTTLTLNIEDFSVLEELKKYLTDLKISYKESQDEVVFSDEFQAKLDKVEKSISNNELKTINPQSIWTSIKSK
jgi:hypothetical protein